MKTYKDVYQRPYSTRGFGSHIWDKKGHMVAQFEYRWTSEGDYEPTFKALSENIIDVLNSDNKKLEGNSIFKRDHIYIYMDNDPDPIITIRGWGGLTGIGGYRLSEKEAANVQDTFAEWIVNKLNTK